MNKNEELQKWLNDDRYVQRKELEIMWSIGKYGSCRFLKTRKIKPVKNFHTGQGQYTFYDKQQCINARAMHDASLQELLKCLNDTNLIPTKELALNWGLTIGGASCLLSTKNIKPIKKVNAGRDNNRVLYDRAECERARPFINQPEQKEVEQVENIEELATATKHQILIEACADDFVWDKVTMKNKIMPVKNYCDERGNFVSLFKKDETVSAILAYKNEQKQLLEKCLADKNLVTTKDLVKIWNLDKSAVYNKIYRLKIKPYAKIKLDNGSMWHFYKKSDCIESQEVEKVEEKQMELPEPKEQSPDIIPADTIDLFTMSELESELKQRGVELTAEVRAKINASDMPEMQHIATMLRGNAKTIAIRLSVLNDIAGQLKSEKGLSVYEKVQAIIDRQDGKNEPKTMQLTTEQKRVFCMIKEMTASGSVEIRQSAVAKKLSSKYNIGYDGARVAVSRAVKNMEIRGYVVKPSFGVVLIRAEYIGADIVEARSTSPIKVQEKTSGIKSKYKLDLIMSRLEEISLLRKEIAELKQMMITSK